MPIEVFLMVLGAALLHATWNAVVKSNVDRLTLLRVFAWAQLVVSLGLLPFVDFPDAAGWPYLAASPVFSTGYLLLLNRAYRIGDLSLVYPLARGAAPLVVAIVSTMVLGEELSSANQIGVMLICIGITSLALTRGAGGAHNTQPVLLALAMGTLIATYTLIDGMGARLSGTANGYMVVVTIPQSVLIIAVSHAFGRGARAPIGKQTLGFGIASGLVAYVSTWLIIWSYTLAPIALVSALRETGIVFAIIIGVVVLKERLNVARLISIAATLCGTTLLKFGR
jgi:drug/metabolite transporter (DMT)-like permease